MGIFTITSTFLVSNSFPSLEMMNSNIILEKTMKIHFSRLMSLPTFFKALLQFGEMSGQVIKDSKIIQVELHEIVQVFFECPTHRW
jgi:hypothetical protein